MKNSHDANSQVERYLDNSNEYTHAYEREHIIKDWDSKARVAEKIVEDFKKRAGKFEKKKLLDAGFGNGAFSIAFSRAGAVVSGIEVNQVLLDIARENLDKENIKADLRLYEGASFPFEDKTFDYVYSTSVLEHVNDAKLFIKEIDRVLRPGGLAYLSFPNRWAPRETHTGLLFISYLPRSAAEWYVKSIKKRNTIAELNLHFLSYLFLLQCLKGTGLSVRFELESTGLVRGMLKKLLARLHMHHSVILKTIMVVLEKR
ncbi:MAG: hypothetical protein COV10_02025 [Candidatus Vogelbacteria bacterium CG10_big_fil_rev_8_21_14_0_10_51_16]|uniref:Methyltransferase type 11 domain-containing protein n=1 Tax=Candidatus Vogelbacteria bacterium CG10_big_fil_rev_8_21_14_0_10_51_16 TaxID=1975045 RepID=A0A2H0REN9_9BACT|nr:MAG: hypothetical protein COV10_02025 [Candidatus Vogelbacteria bacterium CG10_big_fil_rev_8_21_14_0_10_51_16]